MRQLMKLHDPNSASILQQMLQARDIRTEVTDEISNAYLGTFGMVVWVEEDANEAALQEACGEFERWKESTAGPQPTKVALNGQQKAPCTRCGYDLRGQVEDGNCPECGYSYKVLKERPCPHCQAIGPADFDVCWRCGGDTSDGG